MHTPQEKTSAFDIIKNYMPAIVMIGAGFVSIILTWKAVGDNTNGLKELRDQVTRQYSTQREMNDKTNKEVDNLKLWVEHEKGRQEGYKQAQQEKQ